MTTNTANVREAQTPLRDRYKKDPGTALVADHGQTSGVDLSDPFHSLVVPMPGCGAAVPISVHKALGGPHDAPTPGDVLCAALAACQDSSMRMIANLLGVELELLEVNVAGDVDVRGTMMVDRQVPVGFLEMRCNVRMRAKPGTDPRLLDQLKVASEKSCVVLQTLRAPLRVEVGYENC